MKEKQKARREEQKMSGGRGEGDRGRLSSLELENEITLHTRFWK